MKMEQNEKSMCVKCNNYYIFIDNVIPISFSDIKRRTIYEYHKVVLNVTRIVSNSIVYIHPLPSKYFYHSLIEIKVMALVANRFLFIKPTASKKNRIMVISKS